MLRLTRPLYQVLKKSTGLVGVPVHPNPLPELTKTYESTLVALQGVPKTSVYRQAVESLVKHKLKIIQSANGDILAVEKELNEGQIEESLDIASQELNLVGKMAEWQAYVSFSQPNQITHSLLLRWEPLEEKPEPGQWEYPGQPSSST